MFISTHTSRACCQAAFGIFVVLRAIEVEADVPVDLDLSDSPYNDQTISIAAGYKQSTKLAPAVTSIVTRNDIDRLGVRTLGDALRTVTGVDVVSARGWNTVISMRGIQSELTPHALIMLDGQPYTQGFIPQLTPRIDEFPVNNIDHIEIIRGPSSALYGADAFSGAINIVTRTASHFKGTTLGARAGYFDTFDGWLSHGGDYGPLHVGFSVSGSQTRGYHQTVREDTQTQLDRLFGTRASLAPGDINTGHDTYDTRLNLSWGGLQWRIGYFGVLNSGTGTGFVNALDPTGQFNFSTLNTDLAYNKRITDHLELNGTLSYIDNWSNLDFHQFPPGAFGGALPFGAHDELDIGTRQTRGDISLLWTGSQRHLLKGGFGFYDLQLYQFDQLTNNSVATLPQGQRILVALPGNVYGPTSAFGLEPTLPRSSRQVYYGYGQDEIRLTSDIRLTLGVRVDGYTDVGTSVTPRGSLVVETGPRSTLKLNYGRAFRAPLFDELYVASNNLVQQGNPNLKPETIDWVELALNHWTDKISAGLTVYGYRVTNPLQIRLVPASPNLQQFENGKEQTGLGLETDLTWQLTPSVRLKANYAFQNPFRDTVNNLGVAPRHLIYGELSWEFVDAWSADINAKARVDRDRALNDPRPPLKDDVSVNLSLRRKNIFDHIDLSLSVRNLLNEDLRDPSTGPQTLPFDIPLARRNIFGELRINFD